MLTDRKFADSSLEGDGFELFVPRHESAEFRTSRASRVARVPERVMLAAGCTTYRGGPSYRGFVQSASAIVPIDPGTVPDLDAPPARRHPRRTKSGWTSRTARAHAAPTGSTCSTAAPPADAVDHDPG